LVKLGASGRVRSTGVIYSRIAMFLYKKSRSLDNFDFYEGKFVVLKDWFDLNIAVLKSYFNFYR